MVVENYQFMLHYRKMWDSLELKYINLSEQITTYSRFICSNTSHVPYTPLKE